MISEADAVVVGAGALGLSTAFHLAQFGVRRVALVDRFAPGSQTSARAAGLFKLVQADETRTRLARLSVQKVTRFMEETGDRKSTRLNSSHGYISYAVFCLKKKKKTNHNTLATHS